MFCATEIISLTLASVHPHTGTWQQEINQGQQEYHLSVFNWPLKPKLSSASIPSLTLGAALLSWRRVAPQGSVGDGAPAVRIRVAIGAPCTLCPILQHLQACVAQRCRHGDISLRSGICHLSRQTQREKERGRERDRGKERRSETEREGGRERET